MLVGPESAIIAEQIIHDGPLRRVKARISGLQYIFRFQIPEKALCRGVIPTVPSTAEALLDLISLEQLTECQASVLAALIRMKQES